MRAFTPEGTTGKLRYHELPGEGTPILFVHGLGCSGSSDYPEAATDPALVGHRMLLIDLLGFGFSDRPNDFGYTVEDHARTLIGLMDRLALSSVDLVGHSMGGAIAVAVTAASGERVRRLVLSEPNLDSGGGVFSRPIAAQSEAEYVARGHAEEVRKAIEQGHLTWSGSLAVASPVAVYRGAMSLVRGATPTWRARLTGFTIPRTVIFGANSLPDPDTGRLPGIGVAVRIVPDAGHAMSCDNPSGFAARCGRRWSKRYVRADVSDARRPARRGEM